MARKKKRARPYEILGKEPEAQVAEAEVPEQPKPKRGRPRKIEKTAQKFPETEKVRKGTGINLDAVLPKDIKSRVETCPCCGCKKLTVEIYL
jgi:hypothetical protein